MQHATTALTRWTQLAFTLCIRRMVKRACFLAFSALDKHWKHHVFGHVHSAVCDSVFDTVFAAAMRCKPVESGHKWRHRRRHLSLSLI